MGLFSRAFAAVYDRVLRSSEEAGLAARRRDLLGDLQGSVLEIGAGTGANLQHYPTGVTRLALLEPEEPMAKRLRRRLATSGLDAEVRIGTAENIPFEDASFDHVVSTLVLCTVSDVNRTLSEIRRVLVPGGDLLLIEHVRSEDPKLARWQDRWNPIWKLVANGCNCNRDTAAALRNAGFSTAGLQTGRFPKSIPIAEPLISGTSEAGV